MKFVEVKGKTIEDAVNEGLSQLNIKKEDAQITVIEEPTRGFLGLIGGKLAKVKVSLKDNSEQILRDYIQTILDCMNIQAEMNIVKEKDELRVNIMGKQVGSLIGRRGDTLDSLQFLAGLAVNKESKTHKKVLVDVENYRAKREESLVRYAKKLAREVAKSKKSKKLESMNPYERRIIHSALQDDTYVSTYSEGIEPNRKVVITLKK